MKGEYFQSNGVVNDAFYQWLPRPLESLDGHFEYPVDEVSVCPAAAQRVSRSHFLDRSLVWARLIMAPTEPREPRQHPIASVLSGNNKK